MYEINFRKDVNLLDISWHGLFDADDVAAYARDVKARFVAEGFSPGYRLRMDMRRSAVQPQEAVAAFRTHLGEGLFPRASRIAIVTASVIAKLQVRREMTQPYMRIFTQADEAFVWLIGAEAVAATTPKPHVVA
ncbi:STAS/SEC14 domain-containing protein [Sphingobium sp. AR-3-1]|uniref:STAS/SEC14 domain-containing protein n=1 Tax=Sphingobium psychrophilum TaxID=2728834 RepID=A0A7X9ZSV9_9SPHN|nr:STAS/SEC14 domain-containing protein [Sphingobium psychrophilum]NML09956.1 STAS/SEC14 domain-containing protein [Sphingobium psychrophilum]